MTLKQKRSADFRRRAEYAPDSVYRHRTKGWEYIPIHPFGDEPVELKRLGIKPENCLSADAWWAIDDDATLFESAVISVRGAPSRLIFKPTSHEEGWVYVEAVFAAPYVMRSLFEDAMEKIVSLGFPRDDQFRLVLGDKNLEFPL